MTDGLESNGAGVALLYLIPSLVATVASLAVGVHLFDRSRSGDALRYFAIAVLGEAVWSAGIVAELSTTTLGAKLFWDTLQLPALFVSGVSFFVFARVFVGRPAPRGLGAFAALYALPLATMGFVFTDPLHHLARRDARLVLGDPFDSLVYSFTTIETISFVYFVGLLLAATVFLVRELVRQPAVFRLQTSVLTIAVCLPIVTAFLAYAGIEVLGQRDASPVVFGASAILVAYALARPAAFELLPVARNAVFGHIPDGVLVVDAEDRIVDANPAAHELLGPALVRKQLATVLPEATSRASIAIGDDEVHEIVVDRHGTSRALDVRVATFGATAAETAGRVLLLTDVTARVNAQREARNARDHLERRVAERTADLALVNQALSTEVDERAAAQAALAESEQRFRAVFDQTFQLLGVLTLDGTVIRANQTSLEFAGVEASAVEGLPFWQTAFWSHSPELQDRLRNAVCEAASGKLVRFEATHPGKDGIEHVIDFSIKPIVGADGKPVLLIPEGRDVTEKKRADETRAQLEIQLHQAQKMESLGRLAGGIAHDFNNLLTAILGNASLIVRKGDPESQPVAFARDIIRAGESAAELTRQLLAFSRRQMIQRRSEDLGEVVDHAVRLLSRVVGDDIEVVTDVRSNDARANVDTGQIEQAIINLAVNARDAMPEGGRLTIVVDVERPDAEVRTRLGLPQTDDDLVTIAVHDTGTGMTPDVIERVFEPFFTTKPIGRGTGLGLAMVFGAMRQNDGAVDVVSELGAGTTFRLYFPRTKTRPAAPRHRPVGVPRGAENVVVVEDQPLVRDLASRWLTELGYRVRSFGSAEEAISGLGSEDSIDLLLTDVVLPGMSGRLLAERLLSERRTMRVLYMSGYNDDVAFERVGSGSSSSGAQILSKPFTFEQLANAIRLRLLSVASGETRLPPDAPGPTDAAPSGVDGRSRSG